MILLIEDDFYISKYISEYLSSEGENIILANNYSEAQHQIYNRLNDFEIVLLDIMLPDGNGLEILKELRRYSETPVLIISSIADNENMVNSLDMGADDYLLKPFEPNLLLAKINSIRRRNNKTAAITNYTTKDRRVIKLDKVNRKLKIDDIEIAITSNEFDLIFCFFQKPGEVISKQNLSEVTTGKKMGSGDRAIDMHISNIRNKCNLHNELKTIWGKGYLLIYETIQ
ncbi:MAG TPA: response regulator transcription factor [Leptospiraceae bacterium]|nr:response regulator transcription factor [Leptospiraceae bacterium]HRG75719.1 response regulator transcription factor [Leptospiraceae bacterium]